MVARSCRFVPACGQINSTLVTAYHPERASVEFSCERSFGGAHGCGFKGEQSVLGGKAKVQWKVDWALRWYALRVDYELYGKDLIDSARLSGQILRLLGGKPPLGFAFEMFLDEEGHKVSKSVGRGVGVDQWQRYAPIEVLKYFLMLNPRRARKLFLEAIPQYVDEYLDALRAWADWDDAKRAAHRAWSSCCRATASAASSRADLWTDNEPGLRVGQFGSGADLELPRELRPDDRRMIRKPELAGTLMECALNFYRDFVEPTKSAICLTGPSATRYRSFAMARRQPRGGAEEIEKEIYELGRRHYDKPGKIFRCCIGCCWARNAVRAWAHYYIVANTNVSALLTKALQEAEKAAPKDD